MNDESQPGLSSFIVPISSLSESNMGRGRERKVETAAIGEEEAGELRRRNIDREPLRGPEADTERQRRAYPPTELHPAAERYHSARRPLRAKRYARAALPT